MTKSEADWFSKIKDQEYFEKLSHPHFLELDELIILEAHYTPENFELWKGQLESRNSPADFMKTENTINHVHLDELVSKESLQAVVGEYLKEIWIEALHTRFPNRKFVCKVEHYKMGWELVLWKQH